MNYVSAIFKVAASWSTNKGGKTLAAKILIL